MAQSVERRIGSAEVTGPIPVSSSLLLKIEIGIHLLKADKDCCKYIGCGRMNDTKMLLWLSR